MTIAYAHHDFVDMAALHVGERKLGRCVRVGSSNAGGFNHRKHIHSAVAGNLKRDCQRNACKQNDRHRALA